MRAHNAGRTRSGYCVAPHLHVDVTVDAALLCVLHCMCGLHCKTSLRFVDNVWTGFDNTVIPERLSLRSRPRIYEEFTKRIVRLRGAVDRPGLSGADA